MQVGVDTGGTFTDVVAADGRINKVLSTPDDPVVAVRRGIDTVATERPRWLAHGTTVATNALLERRGAAVALVTNAGFVDVIEIARQNRPSLYDPFADRPDPLVPRGLRYEVQSRVAADGSELAPLDPSTLPAVDPAAEAVAVCLLHADLHPAHESALRDHLEAAGHDVTCSHDVSPEFREYERTVTTVVNAYLRPRCSAYLRRLHEIAGDVVVMTSAGGLIASAVAAELPVSLLLSGPAAGVAAAASVAAANGHPDALTFDMGGTSTDVCLVRSGVPEPAPSLAVGGLPVRMPSLDIHTIGAGGGSLARLDPGGALTVGPGSAGADPGPACYGRGGREPTVTDANLVLGRIPADARFGDLGMLDRRAAADALAAIGVDARGVVDVANTHMEQALRAVSVERGVDPRGLAIVAFGGAGPLHACDLADALGVATVIVPARAGVLSAVGLLTAPEQRDVVRSWPTPLDHDGIDRARRRLEAEVRDLVGHRAEASSALDARYVGQSHELTVDSVEGFHTEHERRNGYARPEAPVEVIALRARARRRAEVTMTDLPSPERAGLVGPGVLAEPDCTVWVPDGWVAAAGVAGALVVSRRQG